MPRRAAFALVPALMVCAAINACADPPQEQQTQQNLRQWDGQEYRDLAVPQREIFPTGHFVFARIRYTSYGEDPAFNQRGRWTIDYPESDEHLLWRISELTTVQVAKDQVGRYKHTVVRLTDNELYNYPFVYIVEPGYLYFSDDEVAALRGYLLRGGFLMVDDFWGTEEWINWETQFSRVLNPAEYPLVELPITHPVFNCVFELKEKPQVPNPWHWANSGGNTSERGTDSDVVHFKGVFDKTGRMMAIFCHNTDLGDGWEREGIARDYFDEMSVKRAYPMGINIIVYALTH